MKTAEDLIIKKNSETLYVSPNATISDALQIMNKNSIGAILIKDLDKIVGIWTERDFLRLGAQQPNTIFDEKIENHMIRKIIFAQYDVTIYHLMDQFLGLRFRHIPILKNKECIGILSAGDVMKAVMMEKDRTLKDLNSFVSWEYYENWRW